MSKISERYNADLFFRREREITRLSKRRLKAELWLYKKCLTLHMQSIEFAHQRLREKENGEDQSQLFYEAFIPLNVKILHNAEGIINLLVNGLYGSAFGMKRTLLFDVLMVWYLYFHPELIRDWLAEKFVTSKNIKWRDKFSERTIISDLGKNGQKYNITSSLTEFSFYSKALHPSFFGIRFFQNRLGFLAYVPELIFEVVQWMIWSVIALILQPTQILLMKAREKHIKDPVFKRQWLEYNRLMTTANYIGLKVVDVHKKVYGARNLKDIELT